jgi:ankyrin repeat protein
MKGLRKLIMWLFSQRKLEDAIDCTSSQTDSIEVESESDDEGIDHHYPPLLLAAEKGDLEYLKRLLNAGADINQTDSDGYSALHMALLANFENQETYTEVINFLIDRGIDANLQDLTGQTALHYSIEQSNLPLIQKLLSNNAKVHIKDEIGVSPYSLALRTNSKVLTIFENAITE